MTASSSNSEFLQRAENLEALFTHLEKTVQDLDEVVVTGHQRFQELKSRVERLEELVQEKPRPGDWDVDSIDT